MSTDSAAEFTSSPLARRSHLVSGELTAPSEKTQRTPTEHDHDRVLYSAAFRRLGGVTQTSAGPVMSDVHNRLTHSLRVEHMGDAIARILSQDYNGIDTAAVRAACLAHDLGHPPFGHIGEEKLDQLVRCEKHRGKDLVIAELRFGGLDDGTQPAAADDLADDRADHREA